MDKGNDLTREGLVMALRDSADGLVVDHPTLTRFVETLAKDLGKAEMLKKAEGIARGMKRWCGDVGRHAGGRQATARRKWRYMRPLDALQSL